MEKTLISDPQDIRLNNEDEIEAIIGHPPGWTLYWGTTVVFALTLGLLAISWFISYPDIVEAPVVITTENPPIRMMAGASAKIDSLIAYNGMEVKENELLAILDNPANATDVLALESFLTYLSENPISTYQAVDLPGHWQLGPLQTPFSSLAKDYADLKYFLNKDITFQKISNLRKQISEIQKLENSLVKQIGIFEKELRFSQKNVTRDSSLFQKGASSEMEYEKTKSSHLQKSRQLEELRAKSSNNQLEIRRLEATILDLQEIQSDDENENIVVVKKDIQQLMGAIAEWKKTWLLIAPIDGKVELTSAWSEQQYVKAGDEILTVVPQQASTALFTKAFLTGNSIGKVEPGMEVQIRLASFPYQEYGFLEGKIERIADVRTKDGYEARIQLNKGLVTSHKKTLEFKQEMSGIAKIITKDRNLLIRILEKIKVAFEK